METDALEKHAEKNMILSIAASASALFLIAIGALYSEYSGRLALFLDAIINLAAFLFFAFSAHTGRIPLAFALAVLLATAAVALFAGAVDHFKADPFIASLAFALIIEGAITALSVRFFGTRGVLSSERFAFVRGRVKGITAFADAAVSVGLIVFLKCSVKGVYFRIAGTNAPVLDARGVSSAAYKRRAWRIAALCAAVAGCGYAAELSSFVPNLAGGRGWIALALVFLGRKNAIFIACAALFFASAEYAASYLPNVFPQLPSALLIALPYLAALIVIAVIPKEKERPSA